MADRSGPLRGTCLLVGALALLPTPVLGQGEPVGPEFRVNTYTAGYQDEPAVGSDGSGNFVVVWTGEPAPPGYVIAQRFATAGVPLGSEFLVSAYPGSQGQVASDPSGNFVIVWAGSQDPGFGIFGQRYASSGTTVGPAFRVNTYTTDLQMHPMVAVDPSGNFVVVWESLGQDGSDFGIFGQRFASSGAPMGGEFRVNTDTPGQQFGPRVASDAAGNFVVVFYSNPADTIFGQRYAASGAPLGGDFPIATSSGPFRPAVATDTSGTFVVVWTNHQDGSGTAIFGRRYTGSGAPLGGEFRVNTFTTNDQDYSSVAVDDSGNFVVVWESNIEDGQAGGIFGQRYASSGAPLGGEFRVNTFTTSEQRRPSAASDPGGHFVVVWASNLQDGSSYGVFGQRYSAIVPVELIHFGLE